jgi:hypothetical protein
MKIRIEEEIPITKPKRFSIEKNLSLTRLLVRDKK